MTGLGIGSHLNDCIRLPRILHRLKSWPGCGSEFHRLGQHYDEVLSPVQSLGIEGRFSAVWHVIADLELGFSGTQREHESVAILLLLRHRSRVNGLATGGHRHALVNLGAVREIKLEALIAHLGARRIRSIIHGEQADALQFIALSLKPHNVGGYADVRRLAWQHRRLRTSTEVVPGGAMR